MSVINEVSRIVRNVAIEDCDGNSHEVTVGVIIYDNGYEEEHKICGKNGCQGFIHCCEGFYDEYVEYCDTCGHADNYDED